MGNADKLTEALGRHSAVEDPVRALEAGLRALGASIGGGADELAAQLPDPHAGAVTAGASTEATGQDEQELAREVAQRLGVEEAAGLDVLQGTMLAVRDVAGDRALLRRLAAQLPAALKPLWDPPEDADRFRTAQTDEAGTPLRAER